MDAAQDRPDASRRRAARWTSSRRGTTRSRAGCGSASRTRGRSSARTTRSRTSSKGRRTSRRTADERPGPGRRRHLRHAERVEGHVAYPRDRREVLHDLRGRVGRRHARCACSARTTPSSGSARQRAGRRERARTGVVRVAEPRREVLDRRVAARAGDGTFDREYHEIACMIEGDVEIETDDGRVLPAGPGDVIVHPRGLVGHLARVEPRQEVLGGPPRVTRTARWIPGSGRAPSHSWWRRARRPSCSGACGSDAPAAASAASSDTWLHLIERCPFCALTFEREQGGFLGAMTINFLVAVMVWVSCSSSCWC